MIGIDYASVAGNSAPDLRAAKKGGIKYIIQRGSYAAYSRHRKAYTYLPDPHLKRDWAAHKKAGLVRGAYMFPEPRAMASVEDQVATFVSALEEAGGIEPGDLPPVLDIEFPGGLGRGLSVAKKASLRKAALEWMVEAAHLLHDSFDAWPMIYTSARVWDGEDEDSLNADTMIDLAKELTECPLWLARYPYKYNLKPQLYPKGYDLKVPAMWGKDNRWIHQYQGNVIDTPGFDGLTDYNQFFAMKIGEKGERVKWVQKKLGVKADGIFGPGTEKAVCAFQKKVDQKVDGVVGIGTFAYLAWE